MPAPRYARCTAIGEHPGNGALRLMEIERLLIRTVRYDRVSSIRQHPDLGALLVLHIIPVDTRLPRRSDGDDRQILRIGRLVIVLAMAISLAVTAARDGG